MSKSRRKFLKTAISGTLGIATINTLSANPFASYSIFPNLGIKPKMKLTFEPYELQLTHTFTLANSSRKTTPVVLTQILYDGVIGYGEASLPPYLGETQASVIEFLKKVDLSQFSDPFLLDDILEYIDSICENNTAAKASIDIALHDLVGKLTQQPLYKLLGLNKEKTPITSYTIGIDTDEIVRQKTKEARPYKILKVKLGRDESTDKRLIEVIRKETNKPIIVDANQGWEDKHYALDMIYWLKENGVELIEQPMSKHNIEDHAWLTDKSPLPLFADEAFQRLNDIQKLKDVYSGVNIKLMKCTGIREASKICTVAKAMNMKIMLGCMTETSCAISAATHLSPLTEWADLDGNLLIDNDKFSGVKVVNGKLTLNDNPGIGLEALS